jgi:hypothetical protein
MLYMCMAYKIQTPENYPEESTQYLYLFHILNRIFSGLHGRYATFYTREKSFALIWNRIPNRPAIRSYSNRDPQLSMRSPDYVRIQLNAF